MIMKRHIAICLLSASFVLPALAALKAAGVAYQAYIYPGVEHGFNNDTTPRFDAAAAKLAWQRTIAFFNRALRP